jgi:hypothetical protein
VPLTRLHLLEVIDPLINYPISEAPIPHVVCLSDRHLFPLLQLSPLTKIISTPVLSFSFSVLPIQ